tara:strand:+ start:18254 stop:19234 length:981 start_codon:yes stop_codon:yes gene_type:complete
MSEGQRTTPYELKVPIDSSLMGFLRTGLPGPEICRIMNFDTSLVKKNKTNLFNLFQLLKKHYESIILTKPEVSATAPIVYPSANLAKVLNLLPNKRIHKQKIIIKLIEYIKENNLQHPAIWYKFKMNKFLNALRTNSPVDDFLNENENNTDNTTNIPQTPLVLYRFDDLETIFESHFIDNKESILLLLDDELCDFFGLPAKSYMSEIEIFDGVLQYIVDNNLQSSDGIGINFKNKKDKLHNLIWEKNVEENENEEKENEENEEKEEKENEENEEKENEENEELDSVEELESVEDLECLGEDLESDFDPTESEEDSDSEELTSSEED